ncbi:MAG: HigA family addiction module antitoxin [Planctomycetaceae bacterium]|nr:HigA family addiction module antitoxin [Planctomycetaceae bacterium]
MSTVLKPVHPGEIFQEEFLKPMGITQYRLAKDIGVQPTRVNQIIKGRLGVTADTALRLGRYFGMSPQFWLNLQSYYDLERARERLEKRIEKEVVVRVA